MTDATLKRLALAAALAAPMAVAPGGAEAAVSRDEAARACADAVSAETGARGVRDLGFERAGGGFRVTGALRGRGTGGDRFVCRVTGRGDVRAVRIREGDGRRGGLGPRRAERVCTEAAIAETGARGVRRVESEDVGRGFRVTGALRGRGTGGDRFVCRVGARGEVRAVRIEERAGRRRGSGPRRAERLCTDAVLEETGAPGLVGVEAEDAGRGYRVTGSVRERGDINDGFACRVTARGEIRAIRFERRGARSVEAYGARGQADPAAEIGAAFGVLLDRLLEGSDAPR